MIEERDYKFTHEEPKRERTAEELEAKRKREEELYKMGFRPFTCEW